MSDSAVATKKVVKAKTPVKPKEHPATAEMVQAAVTNLKDKKGSSLIAIKKYIQANYKGVDMERLAIFIRRALKKAVADGVLVQPKGSGASGSFKLNDKSKAAKPKTAKKPKKSPKKPAAKKMEKTVKPKAKKPAAKKAKKPAVKKAAAKKPAAKKPAAKKPVAKKAAKAKKAAPKAKKAAK